MYVLHDIFSSSRTRAGHQPSIAPDPACMYIIMYIYTCIHMQIVIGDQLTCKVIRGCKLWRQYEVDKKDRLAWANEMPGVF